MKLHNTVQIREIDAHTVLHGGIASYDLMERAAERCIEWILNNLGYRRSFIVLCGAGNNGGDGLAIARMLHQCGLEAKVLLMPADTYSADNLKNQEALKTAGVDACVLSKDKLKDLADVDVVWIDALLGTGARAVTDAIWIELFETINRARGLRVAIDLPSGLQGEAIPEPQHAVIRAAITLCFHKPRLSFFFEESAAYIGHWDVLDIGLIEPDNLSTDWHYTTQADLQQCLHLRNPFAHKGSFGHALLAGGSIGKAGAVILSAKAALRSGTGKVTAFVPRAVLMPMQSALPEAMCMVSESESHLSGPLNPEHFNSIAFGMGAGTHDETARLLKILIQNSPVPLVLDADALNILSENKTWLAFLPASTILTPHPGEFDRLAGKSANSFERWQHARELAIKSGCIVILKGAYTRICLPSGQTYFNSSGNAGMATAGSGDALSGIIAGLLAQGYSPEMAAIVGVFVHGMAGDAVAEQKGKIGMLAGDLIEALPEAWKKVE
jgi:hydroxyethylthiazole kinase-like uncharacterized protein yjeF